MSGNKKIPNITYKHRHITFMHIIRLYLCAYLVFMESSPSTTVGNHSMAKRRLCCKDKLTEGDTEYQLM